MDKLSRRVPCFNPKCWSRRIHHERPDTPRGQQMCEVPLDWDGSGAFCSITCACESGFMALRVDPEKCCKKCFVRTDGTEIVHSSDWVCTRAEVTEKQFLKVKKQRDERLARFRETVAQEFLKKKNLPAPIHDHQD